VEIANFKVLTKAVFKQINGQYTSYGGFSIIFKVHQCNTIHHHMKLPYRKEQLPCIPTLFTFGTPIHNQNIHLSNNMHTHSHILMLELQLPTQRIAPIWFLIPQTSLNSSFLHPIILINIPA